jgi:hypothetical protein
MSKAGAYRRAWEGGEWQSHARALINLRHGASNVQSIPDHVQGDAGLECFTMNGCVYQCYAPEEATDTNKAAKAMKRKAARDLKKLQTNEAVLKKILQSVKIHRWIMFVPFLDDKDVVAFARERGNELKELGLDLLADDFEVLIQSQEDFAEEIETLRGQPINPRLAISEAETAITIGDGQLATQIEAKLRRAYPHFSEEKIKSHAAKHVLAYAEREATMAELRRDYPMLWDTAITCIASEERRLTVVGAQGGVPTDQLLHSLDRIEASMKNDLPRLAASSINTMALGTLSDWLMRCPLDFVD